MEKVELLLPAGNLDKLRIGLQYGGDAFYLGFSPFSMRAKTNSFTKESLLEGADLIRDAGKAFYMTMNIFPRGGKFDAFKKHIKFVRENIKPNAIIVADPGLFDLLKEHYPEVERHMSVQSNVLNSRAVEFWKRQGATRIILPRELMLREIKEIHENVPDIELELFVHGAICMAYSGRCLLSNYMTERDSNQGACAHSCRWKYTLHDEKSMEERKMYLEEEKRPGQFMPVEEDDHGTYFMNSKDNCLIEHLDEIIDAGVCSLKVEGRNKTEYYLATVAKAYRKALDDLAAGRPFDKGLLDEVLKTANRGFIPGFLFGFPTDNSIYYESNAPIQTHKFAGIVLGTAMDREDLYEVEIRNKFCLGDVVEVMTPSDQFSIKIDEMYDLDGGKITSVHGGAGDKILKLREGIEAGAMLRISV